MTDTNTAAYLSQKIYENLVESSTFGPSGRFYVSAVEDNIASGYYGAIIHDTLTGEGILVSRGTQPTSTNDLIADLDLVFGGGGGSQFIAAKEFLEVYNSSSGIPGFVPVSVSTGHSLGGYLAQTMGIAFNLDVVSIGSPGAQAALNNLEILGYGSAVANYDYGNKMTNITNEYDPVGNYGQNIVGSNQVIVNVDDYVSTTLQGRIAAKITQTSHALGLINGQPYDISLGAQWGYQFVQETQKLLHYHSIGNYYSAINQDSFSIANPNLNINFDALTSNLSLYEIVDQNTLNYRLYNNNSISKALSSLSVSSSVLDIYLSSGWSALGSQNSYLDNYDINFGDSRWTAIAENSLLTLNTVPSYNFGFWGAVQAGDYVVNNTISGWNGKLLTYQNFVSPLTFDLDNDGIESNHIYSQNVYFDIDGDGYAEKVGWIGPDDGQLAYDANQDGVINDITELFGDDIMPAFQKLALFDSNRDGKISNLDDAYDDLLVWRDLDQDGFSDEGELLSLYDTGIKEISLAETPMDEYQNENYFSGKATYTRLDNSTGDIVDVHFLNDNVNTWFMGAQSEVYGSTYQINPEALLLPLSRGYGSLASLHIAMTNNEDLRTMMRELVTLDTADFDQISSKITAFLYEWAGVTDNDPEARATGNGSNIDARKVDFIEKFTGVEWKQMGVTEMVGDKASIGVKKIWAEIANFMTARILVQGTLYEEIFQNSSYDFKTDTLTLGDTMTEIISRAQNYISAFPAQEREFWLSIGNILVIHRDELDVDISDITTALDAAYGAPLYIDAKILTSVDGEIYSAIDSGDELITTNVLVGDNNDNVITGSNANDYIFGNGGADTLEGRDGDDFLRGDDGADILYGGDGDDRLEGKGGDDILEGGVGRDDIRGGDGADTLIGGAGQDKLHGGAGADIIDGGAGNDEIDYLESNQGVYVNLKTREAEGGHATGDTYINIENITGSDFADILIGDDADNVINGESGDDIIYGGAGNDALFGASGDDRLYGEEGNDTFDGFSGKEYMDGGEGQDTVNYTHPYNTSGVYANLELAKGFVGAAEGDIYVSIENLTGSEHDDVLVGNNENNIIRGDDGNDIIIGGGGNDILDGGAGYNQLIGGAGDDRFIINPSDVDITWIIDFNPADDVLDYSRFTSNITTSTTIDVAAIGSDTLLSIDGKHLVILKGIQPNELYFSNFQVHATDSTLVDIDVYENIDAGVAQQGDTHGNKLWGTLFSDTINGEGGDDNINALEGDDTLSGGDGNDRFVGGHGSDDIDGGAGVDTIDFRDSYEGVTVNLTNGTGSGGTAEGDTYSSIESVEGSVFDDVIIGNSENNLLSGNVGNDTIHAKGGTNNILIGGAGNDTFIIDQIYGADLPDNGLTALRNNGNGTFTAIGGTPNSITYIYDFEAGNPDEKIDLSSFTISEMYIVRLDDVEVNEEVISGAAVHIFDGTESQLIILKGTSYEDLIEDNFVLPSSFDFADVEWQVIGSDEDDLLLGSTNNDTIFAFEGFDITLDHRGNDVVYGNSFKAGLNDLSLQMTAQQIDDLRDVQVFKITKNSDDTDVIFNFDSYAYTNNFFLYGPFVTITPTAGALDWDNSYSPNGPYTVGATFQLNSILDFTDFADVRNGNDLLIQLVDTNSDSIADATVINLPNNQSVILAGFVNLSLEAWQWVGGGYGTHALPDGSGGWINYNGWLAEALFDVLAAENFLFYDGTLIGTNSADILEGGYGVGQPPFQSPPFKLHFCGTGGIKEGAGA